MKLLDSSIWLDHLWEANRESSELIESSELLGTAIVSLFEIERRLRQLEVSEEKIKSALQFIEKRSIIIPLNKEIIKQAVLFSLKYKLGTIDALIYASAQLFKAVLFTADNDFRGLPQVEIISK